MGEIIRYLLREKMNVRQFILWCFAVYMMAALAIATGYLVRAVVAVADYSAAHPAEWVKK